MSHRNLRNALALTAFAVITLFGIAGATSASVLPRNVVLSLVSVQRYFPQVMRQQYSGRNATAAGNPTATRSVMYVDAGASRKVTLSVDRYASNGAASTAYREAVAKSKIPGFSPMAVPALGESSFGGSITRGSETHLGMGVIEGYLVVGVTLAGYPANAANLNKLGSLARAQAMAAQRLAPTR